MTRLVAEVRQWSLDETRQRTLANARRCFGNAI